MVQDDRQLDGSRHVEVVTEIQGAEAALYLVVDHDGGLEEAEITLELDGDTQSVSFDRERSMVNWNDLDFHLSSEALELQVNPRQDGDLDMLLIVYGEQQ